MLYGDALRRIAGDRDLIAFRDACWYSWPEQTRSMGALLAHCSAWVLPGHGHSHRGSPDEMHAHLARCIGWMKRANAPARGQALA